MEERMKSKYGWLKNLGVVALFACLISSCAHPLGPKGQTGAVIGGGTGAIIGQAIGGNTGGTLWGLLIGSTIGALIGNDLDEQDAARMRQVYETAPAGQPVSWVNQQTGNAYTVIPQRVYQTPQGYCRKAEITATIEGKRQKILTTVCRDEGGNWVAQD